MSKETNDFLFLKENYIWLIVSIAFVIVGFILMSGGGASNPSEFSEALFSTSRLTVAPIIVLVGLGLGFFSIMKKPKS